MTPNIKTHGSSATNRASTDGGSSVALKVRPPPEGKEDHSSGLNLAENPIAGADLIRLNQNITSWEREEALAYDKIYFYGPKARKIEAAKVTFILSTVTFMLLVTLNKLRHKIHYKY